MNKVTRFVDVLASGEEAKARYRNPETDDSIFQVDVITDHNLWTGRPADFYGPILS